MAWAFPATTGTGADNDSIQYFLETLPDGIMQTLPSGSSFIITATDHGNYHACRRFNLLRQGQQSQAFACRDPSQPVWFVADHLEQIPPHLLGPGMTTAQAYPAQSYPSAYEPQASNDGFFDAVPAEAMAILAIGVLGAVVASSGGTQTCW